MTIEEIQKETEKDLSFDDTNLDAESLRIPTLHNKYLNWMTDTNLTLRRLSQKLAVLKKLKWEYYTGKMSPEELKANNWEPFQLKILKNDLDVYFNSDKDLLELEAKIGYNEEKRNHLESVLKGIMNRHWQIRNVIEWRRFTNGIS